MTTPNTRTFKRRLSVSLADVSSDGLRRIVDILNAETYAAKLAADTSAHEQTKRSMTEARARLIESSKRIERFLDR